ERPDVHPVLWSARARPPLPSPRRRRRLHRLAVGRSKDVSPAPHPASIRNRTRKGWPQRLSSGCQRGSIGTPLGKQRSICSAAERQRSSENRRPISCTPVGRLPTTPVGTATAGRPSRLAHREKRSFQKTCIASSCPRTSYP